MPKKWMLCEAMTLSDRAARMGLTRYCSMGRHSPGGPGSIITSTPSAVKVQPGAVPQSLRSGVEPSGSMTCWRLFGVSSLYLRSTHRLRSHCSSPLFSSSFRPKASASALLVRSSQVGPRPPVVIIMSARDLARCTASMTRPGLSPTTVCQ